MEMVGQLHAETALPMAKKPSTHWTLRLGGSNSQSRRSISLYVSFEVNNERQSSLATQEYGEHNTRCCYLLQNVLTMHIVVQ